MSQASHQPISNSKVLCVILGGGQGIRLFPLTKDRAKPAVPIAGKYRLVDIPISNCINSGFQRIYVLTQFNSASLHGHIARAYKFDHFSEGFVEILAAQQTFTTTSWYEGTADAVRKNMVHFLAHDFDYLLILSGDQLYHMDFRQFIEAHVQARADITVSTLPVKRSETSALGIMRIDGFGRITSFIEKPKDQETLNLFNMPPAALCRLGQAPDSEWYLASMGIYVFNRSTICEMLDNPFSDFAKLSDFGRDVIPGAIRSRRVFSYLYQGYWEDVGTIRSFFEANLDLVSELPRFNFFDMTAPIYSRPRYLPGSKINGAQLDHTVVSDGCIINHSKISHSIVGLRTIIGEGTELHRVILLGNDYYESLESIQEHEQNNQPRMGIGRNCRIENAIIDKNARIGDNVTISAAGKNGNADHEHYYVRDGIIIIPKNAVIPHGMTISGSSTVRFPQFSLYRKCINAYANETEINR